MIQNLNSSWVKNTFPHRSHTVQTAKTATDVAVFAENYSMGAEGGFVPFFEMSGHYCAVALQSVKHATKERSKYEETRAKERQDKDAVGFVP